MFDKVVLVDLLCMVLYDVVLLWVDLDVLVVVFVCVVVYFGGDDV